MTGLIKVGMFAMNSSSSTIRSIGLVESNMSTRRILSPIHTGEIGTGEGEEGLDSATLESLHRDSTEPSPTSSRLLAMVKDSTRLLLGESTTTTPPSLPHQPSSSTWSDWLSISTPGETSETLISSSSSSITMSSRSNSGSFSTGAGGESEGSSTLSSSIGRMISQWTGMEKSRVDRVGLSIEDDDTVSWASSSSILPSTHPSPLSYMSGRNSEGEGSYLNRNKLRRLATWINSSGITDHIVELPQSLPLIDLEGGMSSGGDGGGSGNFTNETFLEVDNCTSSWDGNGTVGVNCTELGVDMSLGYNYWALLLIMFSVFAVFGNMLVILSVKRERSLWNVTNYFIVSLAVADLLVAGVVMPFGVYFLFNRTSWQLPPIACDFYIAMDVTCSTSSILNLVAISIDRFIAVTQPIKYAKHRSNTRVWLTIVFVWVFSGLVGSPIVLGLNTPPEPVDATLCAFHNYYFIFFSSLCSFYIPCIILVYLYYRIFKVIRERAKKAAGGHGKPAGTVIENLAQTKRLAETTLGGPSSLPIPKSTTVDDEKCTNTGSGSQEDNEDLDKDLDDGDDDQEDLDGDDGSPSPDSADECQIIANRQVATAFVLESVRIDERGTLCRMEQNGNHDSGYAASNMEEGPHPVLLQEPSPASPKLSSLPVHPPCKKNGLRDEMDKKISIVGDSGAASSKKAAASRFTICKAHKASRRKKEKSSAKRERKATKTLAIVLGLFLACWLPFFTCNIMDAICSMSQQECGPGMITFLLTTWLGYVNSCLNPIIYTIFNPEFRKAFKKLMGMGG